MFATKPLELIAALVALTIATAPPWPACAPLSEEVVSVLSENVLPFITIEQLSVVPLGEITKLDPKLA